MSACGGDVAAVDPDDGRLKVVTTFTVLADIAQNVGGDGVVVESITKPGMEIHGYEPTPSDVRRVADADLVLYNGLGLELWFSDFMARIDAPSAVVTDGIDTLPIASGDYAGDANPHAWMSPLNVAIYARNIADALAEIDPGGGDRYEANAAAYADEVADVQETLLAGVAELPPHQRALVTCEGAFSYLAADAGLTEVYLWPVNSDVQGTPRQVTGAIEYVRQHDVPAVFCESTVSDELQRQVARDAGAAFGGVLYVDSLSEEDGPVPTYLDLIRRDVATIIAGLNGQGS
ncbi:metal ABC transporter substrate-binding protein [Phytoactinopolyspora halotolerans]|uniref:Metal ABC transporter substrate-binding protein n=1 Tax=Phytoactinopolyspora halotolerans TaxID=1981512 RepID=A0A6L9S4P8_9ACTN|nr:metal ABC transporter substrate-binding protein [Phytoactinopolyspora halotolerans]NED99009.1 metal ABC transporter substrate-binding protein [Phytoactinopolyspora halotolerans]